ncbi:MAG: hypothetical protein R3217_03750 [Gammaproteobacteria bacterium]|nr:hypothetical protein [Gammaproteobacteria bacterium]
MRNFAKYLSTLASFLADALGRVPWLTAGALASSVFAVVLQFLGIGLVAGFVMYFESGELIQFKEWSLDPREAGTIWLVGSVFVGLLLLQAGSQLASGLLILRISSSYQVEVVRRILDRLDADRNFTAIRKLGDAENKNAQQVIFSAAIGHGASTNRVLRIILKMFPQVLTVLIGLVFLFYLKPVLTLLVALAAVSSLTAQRRLSIKAANWNRAMDDSRAETSRRIRGYIEEKMTGMVSSSVDSSEVIREPAVSMNFQARRKSLKYLYVSQFFSTLTFIAAMALVLGSFAMLPQGQSAQWSYLVLYVLVLNRVFMGLKGLFGGVTNFNRFYRKVAMVLALFEKLKLPQGHVRSRLSNAVSSDSIPVIMTGNAPRSRGLAEALVAALDGVTANNILPLMMSGYPDGKSISHAFPSLKEANRNEQEPGFDASATKSWLAENADRPLSLGEWRRLPAKRKAEVLYLVALAGPADSHIVIDDSVFRRWLRNPGILKQLRDGQFAGRLLVLAGHYHDEYRSLESVRLLALDEDGQLLHDDLDLVSEQSRQDAAASQSEPDDDIEDDLEID